MNHVLQGMEAIYDVREEIPERHVALERWASVVVTCESEPAVNSPVADEAELERAA
ncbi:hypothetical protein [Paracidovorax cattleyae]|uniref:hypothetical protein n=1 Tax=Paracidovorax cattleyae TaxID=80868 RepID=UPI001E46C6ED|nr:hypothetical protein [Paracidovorax cattleyae]